MIGIIDYGMGNLHSVKNACDFLGLESFVSDDVKNLAKADGLILPGVGAFPDAMKCLSEKKLDIFIKNEVAKSKPLLGICLGMQLLFDIGYEFSVTKGLGLIHGEVVKIKPSDGLKVPHMGWNELTILKKTPLTERLKNGDQVYFVHSYKAIVQNRENLLATTDYGGEITAIVGSGNTYGCQFHPEKSESVGLGILKRYGEIVNDCNSRN